MADKDDIRWGLQRRFELIEWRAYWLGRINRSDLEDRFGVSTPQASADLRSYQEAAPGNIEYDATEKAYVPSEKFHPEFLRLSADRYLIQLDAILNGAVPAVDTWFGSPPPAAVMPTVARSVDAETLRTLLKAITWRREVEVEYQSLTSARRRGIVPHSLAFDGHRWHVRAWCAERLSFRDFVLSRILSVGDSRPSDVDPTNDVVWNTMVALKIVPHPALAPAQKKAIELDYGMEDGVLVLNSRLALAYYVIRRLNLDLTEWKIPPERQQIFLTNAAEVEEIGRNARAEEESLVRAWAKSRG
ncbi:WYL domain-containing protein [Bradyrhizobium arachidis]|uniref:WYL domain-containing protein n=1 Tax=Bradyrhizobium arachidis TaxID=858423 RepID=UPI0021618EE1|nr:WYL domain-containing protein [Bradyrhizobium arachidis]UVO30334.1 WYL domain-containing protein [Bradyrhizobium arachidis]